MNLQKWFGHDNQPRVCHPVFYESAKKWQSHLDQWMDNMMYHMTQLHFDGKSLVNFQPAIDVIENDDNYEIKIEVPGAHREDIKVEVDNSTLYISGEKKFADERRDKNFHRSECAYGYFERTLVLPDDAQVDTLRAVFKEGVLNLTVKRTEKTSHRKQVDIKGST